MGDYWITSSLLITSYHQSKPYHRFSLSGHLSSPLSILLLRHRWHTEILLFYSLYGLPTSMVPAYPHLWLLYSVAFSIRKHPILCQHICLGCKPPHLYTTGSHKSNCHIADCVMFTIDDIS